jgi:hypothetical protein
VEVAGELASVAVAAVVAIYITEIFQLLAVHRIPQLSAVQAAPPVTVLLEVPAAIQYLAH